MIIFTHVEGGRYAHAGNYVELRFASDMRCLSVQVVVIWGIDT